MELVIDGVIYELQATGGISRLFNEILPRMCQLDPTLRITLLATPEYLQQPLPSHPQIVHRYLPWVNRYLRPSRWWKGFLPTARRRVRQLGAGFGSGAIWHSTYFTQPGAWLGSQVVTVHDMVYEQFPQMFCQPGDEQIRIKKQAAVQRADLIICNSETTRRNVADYYRLPAEKLRVTPLAANPCFRILSPQEKRPAAGNAQPFLLYVGNRSHYKNFPALLAAFAAWTGHQEVNLVVVGRPDWSENERRQIHDLKIAAHLQTLGSVDDARLLQLYNQALAFVYPSLYEGFGIPLLEAMACGCPVVASRIASTLEVAGDCPIYFDLPSPESFVAALVQAVTEGRNSARARRGLKQVGKYSWERTARQTWEIYRELS